jgi:hypothetical protein
VTAVCFRVCASNLATGLEAGEAEALIVAKLGRLSCSLLDFAALVERSRRKGWRDSSRPWKTPGPSPNPFESSCRECSGT